MNWINGALYIYGGINLNDQTNTEVYKVTLTSATTARWEKISPVGGIKPPATQDFTTFADEANNRFYVLGGSIAGPAYLPDMWMYNITSNTWSKIAMSGATLEGRRFPGVGFNPLTGKVYYYGGANGPAATPSDSLSTTMFVGTMSNLASAAPSINWAIEATIPVTRRWQHGTAWAGTRLYVYGGSTPSGPALVKLDPSVGNPGHDPATELWRYIPTN